MNSLPTESEAKYSPSGENATEFTTPVCPTSSRDGAAYSGGEKIITSLSCVPLKSSAKNSKQILKI
jgi:hypothetical protein